MATYDGQKFYDTHIGPFVEKHGERNEHLRQTDKRFSKNSGAIWPPARRDRRYYELADRRLATEHKRDAP